MELKNHPARIPIAQLLESCDIKRTRASGPGGQHRNKVETAIVVTHVPTGIVGQASEKRSQHRNREVAIERLRVNLALELRSEVTTENSPSPLWISRVKGKKISINPTHENFPALLTEALDHVVSAEFEFAEAAERLNLSTSQLVKFFKLCPIAFEMINRQRSIRDMRKLS